MSHSLQKRPHDFFPDSDPSLSCSPRRIDLNSPDAKKFRRHGDMSDGNREVIMTSHQPPSSFNPSVSASDFIQSFAQSHIPNTRPSNSNSMDVNSMAAMVYGDAGKKKEKKYTAAEVERIVAEAVAIREAQLREEYENALKTMLARTFHTCFFVFL